MQHLGLLATLSFLFLNLWGIALAAGVFLRNRWLAIPLGPLLLVTLLFGLESLHGLGGLRGWLPVTTLISAGLIALSWISQFDHRFPRFAQDLLPRWREEFQPRSFAVPGGLFLLIFFYAFAWRFAYPDVDGSSEKIADLSYICSYLPGGTIPVTDAWLNPYPSVQYYSFQHYGAALMGRLLGLSPGATYNLAFCTLIGLVGSGFAACIFLLCRATWARAVVLAAAVLGGTGVTVLVHFTDQTVNPWSAMRFIGSSPLDRAPIGPALKAVVGDGEVMDMPGEPFSYSIYLGDYHAPLAGYYFLAVGIASAALWHSTQRKRYVAAVGATLTWSVLGNTWTLPLQGLAIAFWVIACRAHWKTIVPSLIAGAAVIWFAGAVYLSAFTAATAGYKTSFHWVENGQHTPWVLFVLFLAPTLGLVAAGLCAKHVTVRWMALAGVVLLVVSECFYVDDIYSGKFERFNTTLKWWPWIAMAVLLTLGPSLLEQSRSRVLRSAALLLCLYPSLYAVDLARVWMRGDKTAFGKIDGTHFLTRELFSRLILERLKLEPRGVVVERPTANAFTNSAVLPLFAGHRMWLGWLGHEQLWRGYRDDLPQRQETLFRFFAGELPDAPTWLTGQGIDYILWYQAADTAETWDKVAKLVPPEYAWTEIYHAPDGRRVGYWKRKALGAVL